MSKTSISYGKGLNSLRVRFSMMMIGFSLLVAALSSIWHHYGVESGSAERFWILSTLLLLGIAATGVIIYVLAGRLTKPIENLRISTEAIARGDLEAPVDVDCNCEVGGLAQSFRAMVARLNSNVSRIQTLAYEDAVTGLPNRTVFDDTIGRLSAGTSGAIMFIDLDRFKQVNDLYGHHIGDELLRIAADRLMKTGLGIDEASVRSCLNPLAPDVEPCASRRMLFRLAGDEFVALLVGPLPKRELAQTASKLLDSLKQPIVIRGQRIDIGCSIGIARMGIDSNDLDELTKFADVAMYEAKKRGRNQFAFFDFDMKTAALNRSELERDFATAIANGELRVHFQPKFDVTTLSMAGVEALVRWQHPRRGLLSPQHFLPIAESRGVMEQVGQEVFRLSAQHLKDWKAAGIVTNVAINVCPSQFLDPSFAAKVISATESMGVTPHDFVLEVTETVAISATKAAIEQVRLLREAGFRISIDDFGVGYSNLSQLYKMNFDSLKIDRSLIENIDTDATAQRIVSFTIGMAHELGHAVVAEGIERKEQLDALERLDCDFAQGYLLGRPMPPEEIPATFEAYRDVQTLRQVA